MPFWVHGRDAATGLPRDSLFIEVQNEADARMLGADAGMTVEAVEFVPAPAREEPPPAGPAAAPGALQCARCQSARIVPRATIWDRAQGAMSGRSLQAYVNARPDALIFRNPVYVTLYARVCADCGHTELFAEGAEELYKAHLQSKGAQ